MMICYSYGLHPPLDWDEDCEMQINLQNQLWNELILLDNKFRLGVSTLLRTDRDYRLADNVWKQIQQRIEELRVDRRLQRQLAQAKVPTPEIDNELNDLYKKGKEAYDTLRTARRKTRTQLKEPLASLSARRYSDFSDARRKFNKVGLWWSNANAVMDSFDVTLRRLAPWAVMHPKDLNTIPERSRLTNQLSGGISVEALFTGQCSQVSVGKIIKEFAPGSWRARRGMAIYELKFTVYARGAAFRRMATWPMYYSRPIPEDALIKMITVHRTYHGPGSIRRQYNWEVKFVCEIPDVEPTKNAQVAGIDIGWRKVNEGVRVATISGSDGALEYVILPQTWFDRRLEYLDRISHNKMLRQSIFPQLAKHGIVVDNVRAVLQQLQELKPWDKFSEELRQEVADWFEGERRIRRGIITLNNNRLEIYRGVAKNIAQRYGLIAIDKTNIAQLTQNKNMPPETARMRTWSAPHELSMEIHRAMHAAGGKIEEREGPSTLTCHKCGHINSPPDKQRMDLIWRCEKCHALWDQDENAANNLRQIAGKADISIKLVQSKPQKGARLTRRKKVAETTE